METTVAPIDPAELDRLDQASPEDVLRWGMERFHPQLAIVTSFQVEGMVLIDMAHRIRPDVRVVTIDTGRLPQETYALIDQVRGRYGLVVEVVFPETQQVENMVERHGMNLFYNDPALRQLCCHVRKVVPFDRVIERFDAWVTGLRRDQNGHRNGTRKVEIDERRGGVVKVSPLADWTKDQVWAYAHENKVPLNDLYGRGYTSIGCAPCTRAVIPGQPERAGRWWWELDEETECGLHAEPRSERFQKELAWLTK